MSDCTRYEICGFLSKNKKVMPALIGILLRRLCKGNFSECAIHYVHHYLENYGSSDSASIEMKMRDIEDSLMPFELSKVKQLLSEKNH